MYRATLHLLVVGALCSLAHARHSDRPALRQRPRPHLTPELLESAPEEARQRVPASAEALLRLRGGAVAAPSDSSGALAAILTQVAYEVSHCNDSPAKLFGFFGACCNWFLGLSAVYDATRVGPDVISLPMTLAMLAYSLLFSRWAGWDVTPRNFILSGSHMFNVVAQCNQLRRVLQYKLETQPSAKAEISALGKKAAGVVAVVVAYALAAPSLKSAAPAGSYFASDGGPFTIHPWPPVTKLFLSAASLTDLHRPTDKISLTQYAAPTATLLTVSLSP